MKNLVYRYSAPEGCFSKMSARRSHADPTCDQLAWHVTCRPHFELVSKSERILRGARCMILHEPERVCGDCGAMIFTHSFWHGVGYKLATN